MTLLRRHEPRLRALAFRILRDRDLVPDALQETAIKAFRSLDGFRGGSSLGTWLFRITYTVCLDLIRSRQRQLDLAERSRMDGEPLAADPADVVADREALSRALDQLTPEHRATVFLCLQQDLDLGTVAGVLGVPYGTVGSRLSYARRILQAALAEGAEA